MAFGTLTTNRSWTDLIDDIIEEFRKWGVRRHDIILPKFQESSNTGSVLIEFLWANDWKKVSCSRFGMEHKGPQRNLCALREVIRSTRLADQRGIGKLLADMSSLTALPDPNDPYTVLGVPPGSDTEHIKRAYHSVVKKAHPDTGGNREWFDKVQAAAQALGVIE